MPDSAHGTGVLLSFAEDIPHVYEDLSLQQEAGLKVVKRVKSFFEKFAGLHLRFSQELRKLAANEKEKQMPILDKMHPTFNGWMTFYDKVTALSVAYSDVNTHTIERVVGPLNQLIDDTDRDRKNYQVVLKEIKETMDPLCEKLKARKEKCEYSIKLLKNPPTLHGATIKEKRKHNAEVREHLIKAATRAAKYEQALKQAQPFQSKFYFGKLRDLLETCQANEKKRIDVLLATMTNLSHVISDLAGVTKAWAEEIDRGTKEKHVDPMLQIQGFIKESLHQHAKPLDCFYTKPFAYDLEMTPEELRKKIEELRKAGKLGSAHGVTGNTLTAARNWMSRKNTLEKGRKSGTGMAPTLFGCSLAALMDIQKDSYPELDVPRLLEELLSAVVDLNGLQAEGIFRVSCLLEDRKKLRTQLEIGNYDMSDIKDPHVPACVLKEWLRELAEPLIPTNLYYKCIEMGRSKEQSAEKMENIVTAIPEINMRVVEKLMHLVQAVCSDENAVNRMTHESMAIVLSPSFLRSPVDKGDLMSLATMQDSQAVNAFVVMLINHMLTTRPPSGPLITPEGVDSDDDDDPLPDSQVLSPSATTHTAAAPATAPDLKPGEFSVSPGMTASGRASSKRPPPRPATVAGRKASLPPQGGRASPAKANGQTEVQDSPGCPPPPASPPDEAARSDGEEQAGPDWLNRRRSEAGEADDLLEVVLDPASPPTGTFEALSFQQLHKEFVDRRRARRRANQQSGKDLNANQHKDGGKEEDKEKQDGDRVRSDSKQGARHNKSLSVDKSSPTVADLFQNVQDGQRPSTSGHRRKGSRSASKVDLHSSSKSPLKKVLAAEMEQAHPGSGQHEPVTPAQLEAGSSGHKDHTPASSGASSSPIKPSQLASPPGKGSPPVQHRIHVRTDSNGGAPHPAGPLSASSLFSPPALPWDGESPHRGGDDSDDDDAHAHGPLSASSFSSSSNSSPHKKRAASVSSAQRQAATGLAAGRGGKFGIGPNGQVTSKSFSPTPAAKPHSGSAHKRGRSDDRGAKDSPNINLSSGRIASPVSSPEPPAPPPGEPTSDWASDSSSDSESDHEAPASSGRSRVVAGTHSPVRTTSLLGRRDLLGGAGGGDENTPLTRTGSQSLVYTATQGTVYKFSHSNQDWDRKCHRCGLVLAANEAVLLGKNTFHRACFTCAGCGNKLQEEAGEVGVKLRAAQPYHKDCLPPQDPMQPHVPSPKMAGPPKRKPPPTPPTPSVDDLNSSLSLSHKHRAQATPIRDKSPMQEHNENDAV
eukprot:g24189.t1